MTKKVKDISPEELEELRAKRREYQQKYRARLSSEKKQEYRQRYTERIKEWHQRTYNERKNKGMCVYCGSQPAIKGNVACIECRDKKRQRERKRRSPHSELRRRVFQLLSQNEIKCVRCGCDDYSLLELNHKNGGGVQERKKTPYVNLYRNILSGKRSIEDFEVTCMVCNRAHYGESGGNGKWIIEWRSG